MERTALCGCTEYGAANGWGKTRISAQNPENTRPEISPPARSMVLKVVNRQNPGNIEIKRAR
jgi:hypothetical protein